MRWTKKRWGFLAAILAIALVIGWEEKRCQAQAYQCRATYAAQARSERLAGNISVNQRASEQQAIAAACEPNGYFCRLFGPANLPAMLLVFVGIGATWAALRTLWTIELQTSATQMAANAAEKSAAAAERAIVLQFRPRLAIRRITIHDWNVAPYVGGEATPRIEFAIVNTGASDAHIVEIKVQTYDGDSPPVPSLENADLIGGFVLAPGQTAIQHVFTKGMVTTAIQWVLSGRSLIPKDDIRSRVFIAGIVRYRDDVGISRSTGFFREYKADPRRFVALDDPDYEYED